MSDDYDEEQEEEEEEDLIDIDVDSEDEGNESIGRRGVLRFMICCVMYKLKY